MRSTILALILAVGWCTAASAQVGGRYAVTGTNPDGSGYSGTAEITPSSDSTCRMVWNTGSTSRGICMLADKAFAASYRLGNSYGLVIYNLQPDGRLRGVWTIADQPGVGTEILTPAR
jgi:hypothetical protein